MTMRILGYDYTVKVEGSTDSIGACGRVHYTKQIIQVADGMPEDLLMSTVLHEIIEALNYHLELGLEHKVTMGLEAGVEGRRHRPVTAAKGVKNETVV